jgi:hypothetical protein
MRRLTLLGVLLLGCLLAMPGVVSRGLAAEKVITIAQYADAVSLDPQDTNDNASYSIEKPILEGLIGFNDKMQQIPQLAEKWDASPDARVYTFYLRKGVKFHDGAPFNAAAVKANFDRVRNPENKLRRYTLYKVISQIEVIDEHTVRFTLAEPFGAMIATFAHPAGGINSPAAVQKYGKDYGKHPVGTGPYKFEEWVPNDHITLVRNPDYWDASNAAKVDKIIVKPVPEDGTRIAMLQKGDAQFINPVPYSMAEVVKRDGGLRTARRVSHVFVMDVPTYHKPLMVTDAAVNIAPTLDDKRDIIQNAVDLAHALHIQQPKVAILSAVETVTAKIPSTIEAAALCKMADRGQITGALLDGPLAFDNAISAEAARIKHITSLVAGDADILVVPDLEAGNMLAKNLTFMARADAAGIVLGARAPVILTSRADNERTRMASCAVAALYAHARRAQNPVAA